LWIFISGLLRIFMEFQMQIAVLFVVINVLLLSSSLAHGASRKSKNYFLHTNPSSTLQSNHRGSAMVELWHNYLVIHMLASKSSLSSN